MKWFMLVVVGISLSLLPGCRGMYEGFKAQRAEDCYRLNYPDQQQCLQQVDVSYEEYEKERSGKMIKQ